jgi:hypothetical protein
MTAQRILRQPLAGRPSRIPDVCRPPLVRWRNAGVNCSTYWRIAVEARGCEGFFNHFCLPLLFPGSYRHLTFCRLLKFFNLPFQVTHRPHLLARSA